MAGSIVSPHHGRVIAVDFDGTCVADAYPAIGPSIGAEPVLMRLVAHGASLILWTMRSGETLAAAEEWFAERGIPLRGINENPDQSRWTTSPKAHADLYIDDRAFGAPLRRTVPGAPPHIDWEVVERSLFAASSPDPKEPSLTIFLNKPRTRNGNAGSQSRRFSLPGSQIFRRWSGRMVNWSSLWRNWNRLT